MNPERFSSFVKTQTITKIQNFVVHIFKTFYLHRVFFDKLGGCFYLHRQVIIVLWTNVHGKARILIHKIAKFSFNYVTDMMNPIWL